MRSVDGQRAPRSVFNAGGLLAEREDAEVAEVCTGALVAERA